jgi:hypothetical protein
MLRAYVLVKKEEVCTSIGEIIMDTTFVIHRPDGSVDIEASGKAYVKALTDWVGANEISADRLDAAIDAVFAENKDQVRLPKTGLVHLAVNKLGLNANQVGSVSERMNKYITNNPRFLTVKGKGGGVELRTATEEKKAVNG